MATTTVGTQREVNRGDHRGAVTTRPGQRLSTETKHSFKTTEFAAMVAVIVGILVSAALVKGGDSAGGTDEFIARDAWLYVSIVAGAYFVSRGLAKAGSRDAYFEGGTNAERDQ